MIERTLAKCFWDAKAEAIAKRVVSECSIAGESAGFKGVILMVEIMEISMGMEEADGMMSAAMAFV
jgi:hypothetical protein